MTSDGLNWDEIVLKDVMQESDAKVVGKIPLSRTKNEDKLIWLNSVNGIFSVKSAYYEARKVLRKEELNRDERDNIWKAIWTAKVAPKIKFFMWKLVNSFLPTRKALQGKGIQCEVWCAICEEREESIQHLFFNCSISKEIWRLFHIDMPRQCESFSADRCSWHRLFSFFKDKELVEKGLYTLWMIWNN